MEFERKISDEGYNSEESVLSPVAKGLSRREIRRIALEAKTFKDKYQISKLMNNSANGVIYEGTRRSDNFPVCVKQVPKTRICDWGLHDDRKIPKEFEMHLKAQVSHGVVKVLDYFERKTSWVLVMEKPADSVDLFEVSRKCGAIKEGAAQVIFRQLVQTCIELHKAGVLHRDLKDENCLLDTKTLNIKIIDFGCATEFDSDRIYSRLSGTPEFFAPEIFELKQYKAESSTVWTLGTLLYVILLGDIPFENKQDTINGERQLKEFENQLSLTAQNMLNGLLSLNPADRPSLDSILAHPWLQI